MAANRHPGITMHKLSVGGGFIGVVFTVGTALIFVIGFPALWSFVAFSAALGIAIAVLLHLARGRQAERNKPLSILSAPTKTAAPVFPQPEQTKSLFHTLPNPLGA